MRKTHQYIANIQNLIERVHELMSDVGIPRTLAEMDVAREDFRVQVLEPSGKQAGGSQSFTHS